MQCVEAIKTEARRSRDTRLGSQRGLIKIFLDTGDSALFLFLFFFFFFFPLTRRSATYKKKRKDRSPHGVDGEEMA